jgi:hypothetical protein
LGPGELLSIPLIAQEVVEPLIGVASGGFEIRDSARLGLAVFVI